MIEKSFAKSADFFEDNINREELFNMHIKRMAMINELKALLEDKKTVEKNADRNSQVFLAGLSSLFTLQFFLGYYAIFEVSWLGWDLVEPWTYTIG